MFRFDLTGYSYGIAKPLDIIWCGYNYRNVPTPFREYIKNVHESEQDFDIKQYYQKDGRLVLYFGPIARYRNGFELYYQGHNYNYRNGLRLKEYRVIASHLPNEIPSV